MTCYWMLYNGADF